jgi:hypothetical protein
MNKSKVQVQVNVLVPAEVAKRFFDLADEDGMKLYRFFEKLVSEEWDRRHKQSDSAKERKAK